MLKRAEIQTVVLVNSDRATIKTDPGVADRTHIEPLKGGALARVLEREPHESVAAEARGSEGDLR